MCVRLSVCLSVTATVVPMYSRPTHLVAQQRSSSEALGPCCIPRGPRVTMCVSVCLSQLPSCLCIHVQRTSWLSGGAAVKRWDHVVFPEVLDMAAYIYCQPRVADKLRRPKTLDVDAATRLVGGRTDVCGLSSTTYAGLCSIFSLHMTVL